MPILYRRGDLLDSDIRVLCHGCNAQGVMGSGVAAAMRSRYPTAFAAYRAKYIEQGNKLNLGQTIWIKSYPHMIIDAVTQNNFGRDPNTVYVSYDAVRTALKSINDTAKLTRDNEVARNALGLIDQVAFPLIGAGLANGSWKTISAIIEEEAVDFQPVVYTLDGVVPST